jgi:hypothetical protein
MVCFNKMGKQEEIHFGPSFKNKDFNFSSFKKKIKKASFS